KETEAGGAKLSSRGPVTVNWDIKPDILAPGTDIVSTVPGGYQMLQGTSMAAPHAAGAIALLKEAHPNWSNEKILGALKTTGKQMVAKKGQPLEPISQGTWLIQQERTNETLYVLYNCTMKFAELTRKTKTASAYVTIDNTTSEPQDFLCHIPPRSHGVNFPLPLSFRIEPKEKK